MRNALIKKHIFFVFSLFFLIAGCWDKKGCIIYDVDPARDKPFFEQTFERDLYWLTTERSHDVDYMLKYRSSSKDPKDVGNLTIKIAYCDNKPAGFVAYYKKKFYVGYILFIDVDPAFRSKGLGYTLLDYAVKDLKAQGIVKIELVTRTSNYAAQKLYIRYGFEKESQEEGFVYFNYTV